jgi:hypothetical protein
MDFMLDILYLIISLNTVSIKLNNFIIFILFILILLESYVTYAY